MMDAMIDYTKQLYEHNVAESAVKQELPILTPGQERCHLEITDENVIRFCHAFVLLQKKLVNEQTLKTLFEKIIAHKAANKDGDDEEAFAKEINDQVMGKLQEHSECIEEVNALVLRWAFFGIKNKSGQPLFDLFELLLIGMLLVERDAVNTLEADENFIKSFINMPDPEENK